MFDTSLDKLQSTAPEMTPVQKICHVMSRHDNAKDYEEAFPNPLTTRFSRSHVQVVGTRHNGHPGYIIHRIDRWLLWGGSDAI